MMNMSSTEGGGLLETHIINTLKQPWLLPVEEMRAV
jgi:hypothetical protein